MTPYEYAASYISGPAEPYHQLGPFFWVHLIFNYYSRNYNKFISYRFHFQKAKYLEEYPLSVMKMMLKHLCKL